ncbi:hypothetical protein JOB18_027455 [Solea senegalensis]|uniref:Transmembrane protein 109 n=1 Tax=Solea senegalensis TaxID=28829 RepID=A0AAV6PBT8_SOLSE|nr:uncharacterized protein LOC122761811 [Solea senegalensis]KAG7457269.1 hypothetical protein JOB18_027455 [Solea senegalensis]
MSPLPLLSTLVLLPLFCAVVAAQSDAESRTGLIQELRAALAELAAEGRTYLGRLAGEQTVLSVQKAFSQVLGVVAENVAKGLNLLLQHIAHLLRTAGIQDVVPVKVTPEGLAFVAQWVLVALVGYWLFSLAYRLVASTLRRALWLLKVGVALTAFAFILRDHSAGTETMAVRLAILVFVCVLLGVGSSRGGADAADKTAHLEEQVKVLERRLRDMERWTKAE